MAFTFTVEDGTLVAGANSYVPVDYADAYIVQNIHASESWDALSTDGRQRVLSWASRYLDQRATWNGTIVDETQAMRWPRSGVTDIDGRVIPTTEIPKALMDAVCEMARYLTVEDRSTERQQDGLRELRVDVVDLKFTEGYRIAQVPSQINIMLRGLGTIAGGRGSFGKIRKA